MKATGIVRGLDDLNRIVIPKEIVRTHQLEGASMEIFTEDDGKIILRKYQPGCVLCGSTEYLWESKGKWICQDCIDRLATCARPNEEVKADAEPRTTKKA